MENEKICYEDELFLLEKEVARLKSIIENLEFILNKMILEVL